MKIKFFMEMDCGISLEHKFIFTGYFIALFSSTCVHHIVCILKLLIMLCFAICDPFWGNVPKCVVNFFFLIYL